jgi:hypothetical protein
VDHAAPAHLSRGSARDAQERLVNDAQTLFVPTEGSLLDLQSLQAVAEAPERGLKSWLAMSWPDATGLAVQGLELDAPPGAGVLGAVRPPSTQGQIVISPGTALLTEPESGRLVLVELREPTSVRLPRREELLARGGGALILTVSLTPGLMAVEGGASLHAAHATLKPTIGVVPRGDMGRPHYLPLAVTVEGGADWATDLRRVRQPDATAMAGLLQHMESLVDLVWKAEPEGRAWDHSIYGRNWARHQTVASSAIEATRALLAGRATHTLERARALGALLRRLQGSVERAADHLVQSVGGAAAVGPYRDLVARPRKEEA